MNDVGSDAESAALTHEEALQVMRLSPEGLRRLADLDEAIMELRAARRSLLANRLESIKDAFAAARDARSDAQQTSVVADEEQPAARDGHSGEQPAERQGGRSGEQPGRDGRSGKQPFNWRDGRATDGNEMQEVSADEQAVKKSPTAVPGANGSHSDAEDANLQSQLRLLRSEVAELRRQVASTKGTGGADVDLQQVQRRLSYVEAELESRHL